MFPMSFPDDLDDSDHDELGGGQKQPPSMNSYFILIWTEATDEKGAALNFQAGLRDTPFASNRFEIVALDTNHETSIELPPLETSRWRRTLRRLARRTTR
jgi:hypothetical protein